MIDVWVTPQTATTADKLADADLVLDDVVVVKAPRAGATASRRPAPGRSSSASPATQAADLGPALGRTSVGPRRDHPAGLSGAVRVTGSRCWWPPRVPAWESSALRRADRGRAAWCSSAASTCPTCWPPPAPARPTSPWSPPTCPGSTPRRSPHLLRHDVRTVAVGAEGVRSLSRIGVVEVLPEASVDTLARRRTTGRRREDLVADPAPEPDLPTGRRRRGRAGRVVVVWGPAGAPGARRSRSAVAAELAAARPARRARRPRPLRRRRRPAPRRPRRGLRAARRGPAGQRRRARPAPLRGHPAAVGDRLEVLTGLPRPDRWVEVRDGVVDARSSRPPRRAADVVVDTGFASRTPSRLRPARRRPQPDDARGAAERRRRAGRGRAADPVGLTRLARGLVELRRRRPGRAAAGGGQPDARQPRLGRARHPRHGRGLRPAGRRALPARRPGRRATGRWSPAGRSPRPATRRCGAASPALVDAIAPETVGGRADPWPAPGSGPEQQVEPGAGVGDHHQQHPELAGDLVPLGQQPERPVVRRDRAGDVAEHDRQHLDVGQERRVLARASSRRSSSPCRAGWRR